MSSRAPQSQPIHRSNASEYGVLILGFSRLFVVMLSFALGVLGAGAGTAMAASTIGAAPPISPEQLHFGNTADSPPAPYESCRQEFWTLPLGAGDAVSIDWSEVAPSSHAIALYPPGTTDFNFADASAVAYRGGSSNGFGQLLHTAATSGTHVMWIGTAGTGGCSFYQFGAYSFTVHVQHKVVLTLPRVARLYRSRTLTATANSPAGAAITDGTLKVSLMGRWGGVTRVLAVASPVNGKVVFPALRRKIPGSGTLIRIWAAHTATAQYGSTKTVAYATRTR